MSSAPAQAQPPLRPGSPDPAGDAARQQAEAVRTCKGLLFDISDIDLSQRLLSRQGLEELNPHRDQMALIDWIVWHSADYTRGIALKHTRDDEFWVKGHFPSKPMFPGVLMIETAAQLAVYLYNARLPIPRIAAFTRIDRAVFRAAVVPGDDLYVLCQEVKWTRRGFTCDVQGVVGDRIAFEAQVQGLAI
jgi:3-hydroxyacyl-[acyl-carrier-protein] dehydratase